MCFWFFFFPPRPPLPALPTAGGSVKDRIGYRMVQKAEESGRIKPGDTLIEPTSGNTGIGLALAAAIKGYRMIITLPEKMSQEKVDVLKALGAEIIRTPTEAAFDSPESHIGVANRLNKEIPNSHILDQYTNEDNPLAHYEGTAEEILEQTGGKIDMFVAGAGTGGTLSGTARKLKEKVPTCQIIGVDPVGSILAQPEELNVSGPSYAIEGIGYDFIPDVLDRSLADKWVKSKDKESFLMARELISEEGLLCGGSSGTAMHYALQEAKSLSADQVCVVILPDSVRNYMTKFLNNDWMTANGFADESIEKSLYESAWWSNHKVSRLGISAPFTVQPTVSCSAVIELMHSKGFDQIPIVDEANKILGVVTEGNLAKLLTRGKVSGSDPVSSAAFKKYEVVTPDSTLSELSRAFDRDAFAIVVSEQTTFTSSNESVSHSSVVGLVSRIDMLNYVVKEEK